MRGSSARIHLLRGRELAIVEADLTAGPAASSARAAGACTSHCQPITQIEHSS